MKSFALFFLILFVGCCYCQSAQLTKLFTEYKNYRTKNCLTGLTTSTTQQVQNIATNVCTTKSISGIPSGYSSMAYNFIDSSSTYDVFYNWVLSTFNNAKSTFASRCSAGDSSSNSTLARLVAAGPTLQDIQCAFSSCAKNSNNQIPKYLVCIFKSPAITTCPNKCQTTTTTTTTTGGSPTTTGGSTPAPTTPAPTTPAPTTPAPTTVTPQNIKDAFLKRQNEARTCLGINTLVWNTTLANDAQAWANACAINCTSIHSFATTKPPRNERDQGENIWSFQGSGIDALMAIDLGNQLWIKEAIGWKCDGSNCSLTPTTPQLVTVQPATLPYSLSINLTTCGHYTQVIWRQSTSVGCAYAECPGSSPTKYLGVCRYNPPGNFVNMHPLYPNQDCTKASSCINSIQAQRSLTSSLSIAQTSSNTQTKSSTPFFTNGSQVVVFALAIVIVVVVLSIFVVILITFFKNKKQDDYQLLEK